eukprot:NODE_171_length_16024_cov_0.172559.p3 type:complete len:435 gc:universal NODE_171_length_16024_cov_0.172559:15404-14100(-)
MIQADPIDYSNIELFSEINSLIIKYFTCINCNCLLEKPLVYDCLAKEGHFTCEDCEIDKCIKCDEYAKAKPFPLFEQLCIAMRRTRNILNGEVIDVVPKQRNLLDVFGNTDSIFSSNNSALIPKRHTDNSDDDIDIYDIMNDDFANEVVLPHQTPLLKSKSKQSEVSRIATKGDRKSSLSNVVKSNVHVSENPRITPKRKSTTVTSSKKLKNNSFGLSGITTPEQTPSRRSSTSRQASTKAAKSIQKQYSIKSDSDFLDYSLNTSVMYATTSGCNLSTSEGVCVFVDSNYKFTHLVCSNDVKQPKRTFKYLLALSKGVPIVQESYIHDCITFNKRLDELPYLAPGCLKGSSDAPLLSYKSSSKLFTGMSFLLLGHFNDKDSVADLILQAHGSITENGIPICDVKYASKYSSAYTTNDLFDAISHYSTKYLTKIK